MCQQQGYLTLKYVSNYRMCIEYTMPQSRYVATLLYKQTSAAFHFIWVLIVARASHKMQKIVSADVAYTNKDCFYSIPI